MKVGMSLTSKLANCFFRRGWEAGSKFFCKVEYCILSFFLISINENKWFYVWLNMLEKMQGDVITGLRSLVMSKFELCNGLLKLTWHILLLKSNTALYNYDH